MKKILWVLLDSRMGSVGQARGVVNFLDTEKYEIIGGQAKIKSKPFS